MQKILGNCSKGLVFILSAPAGTGKTTLVQMLAEEFSCIVKSISCTTRPPREGEEHGKDYYFLTEEAFKKRKEAGEFLEFANVFGYDYGTSRGSVITQQQSGKHVFLVIDTQGAIQLREQHFEGVYIFLSPPSFEALQERLQRRQTESGQVIAKRLSWAKKEITMLKYYDYHIINDDLALAYLALKSIVIAEEHKVRER